MKKPNIFLRALCGVFDAMIVMLPIQFVMMGVFKVSDKQAELLYEFLFTVYGALLSEYLGKTIGKYFGKLTVVGIGGEKPTLLYLALRELVKAMYIIPFVGWAVGAISCVMVIVRKDGRALHDFVGNTRVMYDWQKKRLDSDIQGKENEDDN